MKLLIYSANYAPEQTGIGKYSGEMAAWLAARGHEVRVVAAPPYYPEWRVAASHRGRGYAREVIDGVPVWRAPLWVPAQPSGLKRVVHLVSFAICSAPVMLWHVTWRPDVVLVVAPAFLCTPAALVTARLAGAASWLHVQDFEVDVAFRQGLLKGQLLHKWVGGAERWLFRRFDRVSSISRRMLTQVRVKGVAPAATIFFPNWVDTHSIRPQPAGAGAYRAELGIASDAVVALFSGSLGRKQGLMLLSAAARLLQGEAGLVFVICGDGVLKDELAAASVGQANVRLLSLQPQERLGELLSMADIHLLPQSAEAADLVMPSKLSGMLASGRPVVATSVPGTEIADVLEDCGVVVPPDDADALAAAVQTLALDPARRARLGANARLWAEERIGKDAVLGMLETNLQALSGASRASARPQPR